jgi:hypothetical protein
MKRKINQTLYHSKKVVDPSGRRFPVENTSSKSRGNLPVKKRKNAKTSNSSIKSGMLMELEKDNHKTLATETKSIKFHFEYTNVRKSTSQPVQKEPLLKRIKDWFVYIRTIIEATQG